MLFNIKSFLFLLVFAFLACSQTEKKPESNNSDTSEKYEYKEIGVSEFKELLAKGDAVLVDVREPSEFAEDYIENATNIPAYTIDKTWDSKMNVDKDKVILTYCLSGYRSGVASEELINKGYKNVYSLKGGISAWKANGLPVVE